MKMWILYSVVFSVILGFITNFPDKDNFKWDDYNYNILYHQVDSPLINNNYDSKSHESKLTFRLTVPVFVKIFHIDNFGLWIIKNIFGFLLLILIGAVSFNILQNKLQTCLLIITFGQVFSGMSEFVQSIIMYDGFVFVFLLIPLIFRNIFVIIISVFLASFCDERGFIAAIFICAYYYILDNKEFSLKRFFRKEIIAVSIGWLLYLTCRMILAFAFGLKTADGDVGFDLILHQVCYLPISLWTVYESIYFIIFVSIYILIRKKEFFNLFILLGCYSLVIMVSLMVLDVTRSLCYLLPGFFISLNIVKNNSNLNLTKVLWIVMIISLIIPNYYVCGNDCFIWSNSVIVRWLTGTF